jgi:hypothetical protein
MGPIKYVQHWLESFNCVYRSSIDPTSVVRVDGLVIAFSHHMMFAVLPHNNVQYNEGAHPHVIHEFGTTTATFRYHCEHRCFKLHKSRLRAYRLMQTNIIN